MELPGQGESFQHKYKLHEILGKGGFAAVYRATDVEIGRDVAIKILAPSDDGYSKGIESRFMREGRVIAGLQDPHTITMFEFGRSDEGLLYMVFEYVRGTDLSMLVKRSPLPEPAVVHIMRQVLQSLREAHAAGVLHRDIKPANILIYEYMDDPYRAKLLDFGIAKPVAGDGLDITSDGAMIGTPRYMAPEQIYGGELSPASDIYSLGLVAYEMLLGKPAITGRTTKEMMVQQLSDTPVQLPPNLQVSPPMRNVINRMTTRDPAARFATADAALQALDFMRSGSGPQHGMGHSGPQQGLPQSGPQQWSSGAHHAPGMYSSGAQHVPSSGPQPVPESGSHGYPNPPTPTGTGRGVHPTWTNRQTRGVPHHSMPPTTQAEQAPPDGGIKTWQLAMFGLLAGAGIVGAFVLPDMLADDEPVVVVTPRETDGRGELIARDMGGARPADPVDTSAAADAGTADGGLADLSATGALGCGLKAGWEQSREFTINVGRSRRTFTVYLPKTYDENYEHPIVMLFHKAFNDGRWIVKDTNIRPIADKEKFIVLAFDASEKTQPWMDNDVEFVEAALAETSKAACIDRGRIFAVGHGGGGDFTMELACTLPLAGTGTVGHAQPRGGADCVPSPEVPFIRMVGMDDNYTPPKGGAGCLGGNYKSLAEIELDWRGKNSCAGDEEKIWFKKRRDVCVTWDCETPFVSCRLEGGHDWPNSTPEKFEMPGCPHPPPDFPMTQKMWDFFEEQEPVDASRWRR